MEPNERRKIVINLDQPGAGGGHAPYAGGQTPQPRKSRRWPKVLAIFLVLIFLVVLAAAVGGYFYWRHYQRTPAYSLALIIDAAQRNDMESFQKQIDDDSIAKNLIAEVTQKAQDRYGIAMSPVLQKQIDTMVPTLLPRLKDTIHEEVAKEIKEFAAKSEPKPFIIVALAVPTLMTITTEGDKAHATATLPNRTIELGLQRDGDRWKVTEMKDEVLLQRIVDSVMKDLPAVGSDVGNELLKQLKKRSR
jgi:uncharacterized membrane protein